MKHTAILLVIFVASAIGINDLQAAETVRFSSDFLKIGSVRIEESSMDMDLKLTVLSDGKEIKKTIRKNSRIEKKNSKITKMKGQMVTELLISYEKVEESIQKGEKKFNKKEPVEGKIYLCHLNKSRWDVTYQDGKSPTRKEIKFIRRDLKKMSKFNLFPNRLGGKKIKIGKRAPFLESLIVTYFTRSARDRVQVKSVRLILAKTVGCGLSRCALFDTELEVSVPLVKGIKMIMKLKGEITIIVNKSRPVRFQLKGPISVAGRFKAKGKQMEVRGTGKMNIMVHYSYK